MVICETTLFYGVFVKTTTLCFAADAYAYSKQNLLAIDMIRSRLRRKELSFTVPSTAISRVPDDVWIKIQQARLQRATLNAELMELRNLGEMEGRQIWADEWEEIHQDENAVGLFWEEGGVQSLVECRLDRIASLLRDYGLAVPLTFSSLVREESEGMDVFSPISLRLESNESESPVLALEGEGGPWDEKHAVAQFSKTAFTLPSDVDLCFKRFLALFNLVAENPLSPYFPFSLAFPIFSSPRIYRENERKERRQTLDLGEGTSSQRTTRESSQSSLLLSTYCSTSLAFVDSSSLITLTFVQVFVGGRTRFAK